jgi:uncharacterized protein (TIGR03435 family)
MKKAVFIVAMLASSSAIGQDAQDSRLAFDVATIKQHVLTGGGFIGTRISGTLVTVSISTVKRLIQEAYGVRDYQILGGPSWISADIYDVTARAPGEQPPTRDEVRRMLQVLLADRFKLVLHKEVREFPAYALVVGKSGSKLKSGAGTARTGAVRPFDWRVFPPELVHVDRLSNL